jgi:hypothetical protein
MALEAEMRRKIVASVLTVGFFVALIVGLGVTFSGTAAPTGGLALVGAIALFVVVMGAVGLLLSR